MVELYWKKSEWKKTSGVLLYASTKESTNTGEVGDYHAWFVNGASECNILGMQSCMVFLGRLEDLDSATAVYGSIEQYIVGDWYRAKLSQSHYHGGICAEYRAVDMFMQGPGVVGSGIWAWTTLEDTYDPECWYTSKKLKCQGIWTADDQILTQ